MARNDLEFQSCKTMDSGLLNMDEFESDWIRVLAALLHKSR
jgi:hypothetical protein